MTFLLYPGSMVTGGSPNMAAGWIRKFDGNFSTASLHFLHLRVSSSENADSVLV